MRFSAFSPSLVIKSAESERVFEREALGLRVGFLAPPAPLFPSASVQWHKCCIAVGQSSNMRLGFTQSQNIPAKRRCRKTLTSCNATWVQVGRVGEEQMTRVSDRMRFLLQASYISIGPRAGIHLSPIRLRRLHQSFTEIGKKARLFAKLQPGRARNRTQPRKTLQAEP